MEQASNAFCIILFGCPTHPLTRADAASTKSGTPLFSSQTCRHAKENKPLVVTRARASTARAEKAADKSAPPPADELLPLRATPEPRLLSPPARVRPRCSVGDAAAIATSSERTLRGSRSFANCVGPRGDSACHGVRSIFRGPVPNFSLLVCAL